MSWDSRADRRLQWGLFFACTMLFAWVGVREAFNGLLSDSYVYLAAATALREDTGLLAHIVATYPFPPLFPLVLALTGSGSAAPARTYVVGALLLAGVVVLLLRWLRAEGVPTGAACVTAIAFALLPQSLQTAMGVLSEPLFMLCLFAAMLSLPSRATPPRRHARAWLAAASLVAAASLTRSVGIAAIAAFVAHWLFTGGWRATRSAPLVAGLPFVAWTLAKKLAQFDDYSLGTLLEREPWRMALVNIDAWQVYAVKAVDPLMRPWSTDLLAGIGVLAAVVWLYRLLRGRFDALFVAAYLAIMIVWPYPHHAARFLHVLLPFALGYCTCGLAALLARLHAPGPIRHSVPALAPAVVIVLAASGTGAMLSALWRHRAEPIAASLRAPAWYQSAPSAALRSERFAQRIIEFQQRELVRVPPNACVASVIPQQVLVFGPRRGLDLMQLRARGQMLESALASCPYVLMIAARPYPPVSGVGSLYPFEQIRERMEVLAFERDRPDDPDSALLAMLVKMP